MATSVSMADLSLAVTSAPVFSTSYACEPVVPISVVAALVRV